MITIVVALRSLKNRFVKLKSHVVTERGGGSGSRGLTNSSRRSEESRQFFTLPNRYSISAFSTLSTPRMGLFKFSDYDCIGFDLDNTLLRYNVTNMAALEYRVLARFMVEERGYNAEYLSRALSERDTDFMQRGLILDFDRGNVLRISSDGAILRACHGTSLLGEQDVARIYPNRRWEATDVFVRDSQEAWEGATCRKMRSLLDYFDMPAALAFARAVDSLDAGKLRSPRDRYGIWPDILDGLLDMFDGENFRKDAGRYFPELKRNPGMYLRKCDPRTIAWLRELKSKRVTCLITGSFADFADFTASYALGDDWRSLFDIVICHAKKPGFFTGERAFVALSGRNEAESVGVGELTRGQIYAQGNWRQLVEFFGRIGPTDSPRCLYVGDNLVQDIYVPGARSACDTVAIVEELQSEGTAAAASAMPRHPDEKTINSAFWGSYFSLKDSETRVDSIWRHIIESYSKICVPNIDTVTEKSIDAAYECFDKSNKSVGYHPAKLAPPRS